MTIQSSGKIIAVTAIVRSPEIKAALDEAVAGQRGVTCDVHSERLSALPQRLKKLTTAGVLLLEVDLDDESDLDALEHVAETLRGRATLVAMASSTSIRGVRRLMQMGVADIVPVPLRKADLFAAISSANHRHEAPPPAEEAQGPRRGRIIAVMKATGGVGATTIAVHMAEALSRRSQNTAPTTLVDLDLQFGSVALHLDLQTEAGVLDAMDAGNRLDPELLQSTVMRRSKDLHVLPAPAALTPLEAITPDMAQRLVDVCAQTYATTIIDLPHTWTAWTRTVLAASDALVLVTQLNVPGIHHSGRQITTLHEEGLHMLPVLIAVNRHERSFFGDDMVKDAEKALGRRLEHFVPSDYNALSKSVDAGKTLYQMRTARKITKRIQRLAEAALAAAEPAAVKRA